MSDDVVDVGSATWESEVLRADGLVMVLFQADWCEPCATIAATIKELAEEYVGKVKAVKLNVDDHDGLASKYKISIVPTIIFFKRGQKLHETICIEPKERLGAAIESLQG